MARPTFDFNPPAPNPGQYHRPPSPKTQRAFNSAARHAEVFQPNTTLVAASSDNPNSFGVTTPRPAPLQPMVQINRQLHDNSDGHRHVRLTQTALHEMVVHAQHDSQHQGTSAADDHRGMFLAPERSQPNSFLAAVRKQIRHYRNHPDRQQVAIEEYDADVTRELEDAANHQGLSPQMLSGAKRYHRNRVNSMTDAISPNPQQHHDW